MTVIAILGMVDIVTDLFNLVLMPPFLSLLLPLALPIIIIATINKS